MATISAPKFARAWNASHVVIQDNQKIDADALRQLLAEPTDRDSEAVVKSREKYRNDVANDTAEKLGSTPEKILGRYSALKSVKGAAKVFLTPIPAGKKGKRVDAAEVARENAATLAMWEKMGLTPVYDESGALVGCK
jgi:hypothetical protein